MASSSSRYSLEPPTSGPASTEFFSYQKSHISAALLLANDGIDKCRVLRTKNVSVEMPHNNFLPYITETGLGGACYFELDVDQSLCSSLIERWRPETHTFMLPIGEATITLDDVHNLLGLPIEGKTLTGGLVGSKSGGKTLRGRSLRGNQERKWVSFPLWLFG